MTKDSALRMALEALNLVQIRSEDGEDLTPKKAREAITAIKEALAQPEQELDKYFQLALEALAPLEKLFTQADAKGLLDGANVHCQLSVNDLRKSAYVASDIRAHLNTTPPQRKPLTDEQREVIAKGWRGRNWTLGDVIDAVESAHGIKD